MKNEDLFAVVKMGISIQRLLQNVGKISNPNDALEELLKGCVEVLKACSARIYSLNLFKSKYECLFKFGVNENLFDIEIDTLSPYFNKSAKHGIDEITLNGDKLSINSVHKIENFNEWCFSKNLKSCILTPLTSGDGVIGFIIIDSEQENYFKAVHKFILLSVASSCSMLLEKVKLLSLLKATQKPIDFKQPLDAFLNELILVTNEATQMPLIALREYIDGMDALVHVANFGFPAYDNPDAYNFSPIENYPTFYTVIKTRKTKSVTSNDSTELKLIRDKIGIDNIGTFIVVPILVGNDIFGTLSFATQFDYKYSPIEVAGFENIANSIGIAIENWRNFHNSTIKVFNDIQTSTSITAVEVAQAARHEARAKLESANNFLYLAELASQNATKDKIAELSEFLNKASEEISAISITLDKIKNITKPPATEKANYSLHEIIKDTFSIVEGRLHIDGIKKKIEGKDICIDVYRDYLIHAFLNLVLNSIDAFKSHGKKSNREIIFKTDNLGNSSNKVKIIYTDNASGLIVSNLKIPDILYDKYFKGQKVTRVNLDSFRPPGSISNSLLNQLLFEPGVTSKDSGSGYGLYLVRKILNDHNGSIDYVPIKNKMRFEITLLKN